ncbi:MAG TPA: addiction module protein [Chitinophagales bacterium]|nr:addiction module protein [Chitinophagales bacterium]
MNYKDLSTSEKILLVEEIWDSIAEDKIKLNKKHKEIIDERLETYHNTSKRTTWEAIKRNVRNKKRK